MQRKFHWIPVLILATSLVGLLYADWVANANSKVIEPYGDGFKAYHAIIYHARYDSTYSWYEGMNYPYGEHIVPGASQPLYSTGMRLLEEVGIPASQYGWAVIHYSILLGLVLGIVFTYLLLRRLGTPFWVATMAGVLMTLMAPQIWRIIAHYGLAHLEVLPMVLYFLHRWHLRPNWKNSLAVALCVVVFSLIHFYYFAILAFTIGGFLGARWLVLRDWKRWWFYALHLGYMFVLPAVGFFSWFGLTDPTVGRNDAPYGFAQYQAHPISVFTSHHQPFWKAILPYNPPPGYEGWAYIGLPALLLLIGLAGRWIYRRTRVDFVPVAAENGSYLNALLLAGFGLLLFSFGFPIDQLGGQQLVEHLGPIRQFRSIGRFAWLFYYAIGISVWVVLSKPAAFDRILPNMNPGRRRNWQLGLLCFALLLATLETTLRWANIKRDLQFLPDQFEQPLSERMGIDFDDYQAIIPIPYYNIGSDNYWLEPSGLINQKVQILNWQTGLSTTGAMLTRTALDQTLNQLQLVAEPYRMPAILSDLPNQKPFLVLRDSLRFPDFGLRTDYLSHPDRLLFKEGELEAYALPLSSFQERINERVARVKNTLAADSLLVSNGDFLLNDSLLFAYTDFSLADEVAKLENSSLIPDGYVGGGLSGDIGAGAQLMNLQEELTPGKYVFSFWMDISQQRHTRGDIIFRITQPNGPWDYSVPVREHLQTVDNNGWGLIEIPLTLEVATASLAVSLRMPLLKGQRFRADDVLLRPAELDIYRRLGDTLYYNNRYYPEN